MTLAYEKCSALLMMDEAFQGQGDGDVTTSIEDNSAMDSELLNLPISEQTLDFVLEVLGSEYSHTSDRLECLNSFEKRQLMVILAKQAYPTKALAYVREIVKIHAPEELDDKEVTPESVQNERSATTSSKSELEVGNKEPEKGLQCDMKAKFHKEFRDFLRLTWLEERLQFIVMNSDQQSIDLKTFISRELNKEGYALAVPNTYLHKVLNHISMENEPFKSEIQQAWSEMKDSTPLHFHEAAFKVLSDQVAKEVKEHFALKAVLHTLDLVESDLRATDLELLSDMVSNLVMRTNQKDHTSQGLLLPRTVVDLAVSKQKADTKIDEDMDDYGPSTNENVRFSKQ